MEKAVSAGAVVCQADHILVMEQREMPKSAYNHVKEMTFYACISHFMKKTKIVEFGNCPEVSTDSCDGECYSGSVICPGKILVFALAEC